MPTVQLTDPMLSFLCLTVTVFHLRNKSELNCYMNEFVCRAWSVYACFVLWWVLFIWSLHRLICDMFYTKVITMDFWNRNKYPCQCETVHPYVYRKGPNFSQELNACSSLCLKRSVNTSDDVQDTTFLFRYGEEYLTGSWLECDCPCSVNQA
jgi:hypothetical protein